MSVVCGCVYGWRCALPSGKISVNDIITYDILMFLLWLLPYCPYGIIVVVYSWMVLTFQVSRSLSAVGEYDYLVGDYLVGDYLVVITWWVITWWVITCDYLLKVGDMNSPWI